MKRYLIVIFAIAVLCSACGAQSDADSSSDSGIAPSSVSSSTSSSRPEPPSSASSQDDDTKPVNEPVDEVITEIPSSQSSSKPDEDTIPVNEPVEEIITEIPSQPPSSDPQSGSPASQPEQSASYSVAANPDRYEMSADSITVDITNTSDVDGGFGRYYRIEQRSDGGWIPLPLEIIVTEDWPLLPAGETQAQSYNLFQDQYDYSPGTYRIVLTGVAGEPSVVFELE